MNRLETFTDAAFAFAVTLIVISVDDVPRTYPEFTTALKNIPTFLACFGLLALYWWGHHQWSRRYGLHDGLSLLLSLGLVATILVFIYPLRVTFGAAFANASGGYLPYPLEGGFDAASLKSLFLVFGVGYSVLSGIMVGLYVEAWRQRGRLALSELEVHDTLSDALQWTVATASGLLSTALTLLLPGEHAPAAAYAYWTLFVTMPLCGYLRGRGRKALAENGVTT